MVHRPPEIALPTPDLYEHFIEIPGVAGTTTTVAQDLGEFRTKR